MKISLSIVKAYKASLFKLPIQYEKWESSSRPRHSLYSAWLWTEDIWVLHVCLFVCLLSKAPDISVNTVEENFKKRNSQNKLYIHILTRIDKHIGRNSKIAIKTSEEPAVAIHSKFPMSPPVRRHAHLSSAQCQRSPRRAAAGRGWRSGRPRRLSRHCPWTD